jgi:inhibitor of cysteine peptidase
MVTTTWFRASARRWMIALAAVSALIALPGAACADDTAETLRLTIGGDATFSLKENPSTGYRWHLDPRASNNLDLIEISDAGYDRGSSGDIVHQPMVGVPGTRSFRITARKLGTAVAAFDYVRDWENQPPAQRHIVTVEVGPR